MQTNPTPNTAASKSLTPCRVLINHRYDGQMALHCSSWEEASAVFQEEIYQYDIDPADLLAGSGNVYARGRKLIGRVSPNGRCWDNDGNAI